MTRHRHCEEVKLQPALLHPRSPYLASIIHDEALFEVKDEYLEIAVPVLAKIMEVEDIFNLPFPTDVKIGKSYGTLGKPTFPVSQDIQWRDYIGVTKEQEPVLA